MSVRYKFREQECVQITYDAGGDRIRMDEYTNNQLQRSIYYWGDYEKEVYPDGSSQEMACQLPHLGTVIR